MGSSERNPVNKWGMLVFQCDIQDSALALFRPCLEDRYQQDVIGNAVSESSLLYCGVPQGSVLCPALFLVYIHTLALPLALLGVNGHFYFLDKVLHRSKKPTSGF